MGMRVAGFILSAPLGRPVLKHTYTEFTLVPLQQREVNNHDFSLKLHQMSLYPTTES